MAISSAAKLSKILQHSRKKATVCKFVRCYIAVNAWGLLRSYFSQFGVFKDMLHLLAMSMRGGLWGFTGCGFGQF